MSAEVNGVKKNKWRMQQYMDRGITGAELRAAEDALWDSFLSKEKRAPKPAETSSLFPGVSMIGYGWEWVVFPVSGDSKVAKIPRGVFSEVNNPEYLEDAQDAYAACMTHIEPFTVATSFERKEETNVIFQQQLTGGKTAQSIKSEDLTNKQRVMYRAFGEGLVTMLDNQQWMPDIWLHRTDDGLWHMRDVLIIDDKPQIYDLTAVYDVYRLSSERMEEEVQKDRKSLEIFIEDMS